MLALIPTSGTSPNARHCAIPSATVSPSHGRVILLQGCAEPVWKPEIRAATQPVLARAGYEVVLAKGEGCCVALVHHMGQKEAALAAAEAQEPLAAILITTSGGGTILPMRRWPRIFPVSPKISARF